MSADERFRERRHGRVGDRGDEMSTNADDRVDLPVMVKQSVAGFSSIDTNSTIEFSEKGRAWLAESYEQATLRRHDAMRFVEIQAVSPAGDLEWLFG
jgi:hypothetical protein